MHNTDRILCSFLTGPFLELWAMTRVMTKRKSQVFKKDLSVSIISDRR